ncbi:MAG TPA: sigma-70 family RNA polymerase sigma factor [Patescibacteria group bacterium]|nr:sigma-70 family RNA polymerase sigma factor [Patescibacteria group bacterium]
MTEYIDEEVGSYSRIQADAELCRKTAAGDPGAGQEFYRRYYRLARYFGNIAAQDCRTGVVDSEDLLQEAFIYMLETAKRYNPDKDIPFSSFTSTFIRHRLSRVVASQYGAKVPVHIQEIISAIDRINSSRLNAQGSPMADDEIVEQFKVRPGGPDHNYVTVGAIRQAMLLTRYIGSIDNGYSPHTDDSPGNAYVLDDAQQLHSVTSEIAPLPEEEVEANILRESLEKLLSTLDRRKADILRMRFGFDGLPPKTLEQVAQVFGVTRDRVRQIEARTLADLRLKKCKELIDYLEK